MHQSPLPYSLEYSNTYVRDLVWGWRRRRNIPQCVPASWIPACLYSTSSHHLCGCLPVCTFACLPTFWSDCWPVGLGARLFVCCAVCTSSVSTPAWLPLHLSECMYVYPPASKSNCMSAYLTAWLPTFQFYCLPAYRHVCQPFNFVTFHTHEDFAFQNLKFC
jgi:hypothetical protein